MARSADVPGYELGRILQRPGTVPTLMFLLEHEAVRPNHLNREMGLYGKFGVLMMRHLEEAGWISVKQVPGRGTSPGYEISLNARGMSVAAALRKAVDANSSAKKSRASK